MTPPSILQVLKERGFVQQVTDDETLTRRLADGSVTFYCGFDPTASSLHLGSMVPLMAMSHLARAGHRPIAVLGGGTSMIGDPSGKTELRQMITQEVIQENRRGIEPQVRRFLKAAGDRALMVDNADWLLGLNYVQFLRDVGRHFSVNHMLAAEAYKMRLAKGLSFIEFNYQILQAYDFLVLSRTHGCCLQIGGDDQWGNILAGTDLIRRMDQREAFGLTFPLITTSTGAKMGKTAAGAVWLSAERTSPFDFYQYFVNVDDRDVERFLKLFTFLPLEVISGFAALRGAAIREGKDALAFEATLLIHGESAASEARRAARAAFGGSSDGGAAVPSFTISSSSFDEGLKLVDLLAACALAPSKSAARRLVAQGGVKWGENRITDTDAIIRAGDVPEAGILLHAGKKHLRRILKATGS